MKCWLTVMMVLLAVTPALADGPKVEPGAKPFQVPYRLTPTNHVLVRAKINDKGPFNFILDTGAPALFVAVKPAQKAGVTAAKGTWTKLDRLEIEGGVVIDKVEARVDDLFQLEGMNGLGLAGAELHGVIGYNVLAQYRIEYDFTRDRLAWKPLDFTPPKLVGIGGKGGGMAGLEAIGSLMKFMGTFLGMKANLAVVPRGFLGIELADGPNDIVVKRVLPESPAAKAGLRAGDRIARLNGEPLPSRGHLTKAVSANAAGDKLTLTIERAGKPIEVAVELGRGL